MQPPNQHQRINLAELKAQIVKKLGPERSYQYLHYLNRFLSLKLSKDEFNKLCLQIVGRENIPLHNQFVRSILKNACSAKVPPPTHDKQVLEPVTAVGNNELRKDEHKQSVPNPSVLSNGDIRAMSARKVRTETHDRNILDRPNSFRPNGKTHNNSIVVLENGDLISHDIQRPVQHHQGLPKQAEENEGEVSHYHLANFSSEKRLPDGSVSARGRDPVEAVSFEDRKEVFARSLLRAPLGVPSCPASVGGARRTIPMASSSAYATSLFNSGSMLDTVALRQRMAEIAASQGLEGVTMDCANLLNKGLDAYLKGLITSCIELVGARSGQESRSSSTHKHPAHLKLVNGVRPGHHLHIQSSSELMESIHQRELHRPISLLDFRVAMEVNPQQLGEDWPILLEKICTDAFEE